MKPQVTITKDSAPGHKVIIRKQYPDHTPLIKRLLHPKMWIGHCTCGKLFQYWDFGATLGSTLEHQRRAECEELMLWERQLRNGE